MFTLKLSENNSTTIYAEYQNREEISRMSDLSVNLANNYIDNYYSFTYNQHSLFSLTFF